MPYTGTDAIQISGKVLNVPGHGCGQVTIGCAFLYFGQHININVTRPDFYKDCTGSDTVTGGYVLAGGKHESPGWLVAVRCFGIAG